MMKTNQNKQGPAQKRLSPELVEVLHMLNELELQNADSSKPATSR